MLTLNILIIQLTETYIFYNGKQNIYLNQQTRKKENIKCQNLQHIPLYQLSDKQRIKRTRESNSLQLNFIMLITLEHLVLSTKLSNKQCQNVIEFMILNLQIITKIHDTDVCSIKFLKSTPK
ncbi:hypothetical protein Cni_G12673 [Canna indica]|uniref:Uncharacterized protein n=1 Tax=Canna indica TaxID=4628 RepID=A0AAQ3KB51_9LILI|nr:hypothetical protein Cni_G12673 [Canna indica]